MAAGSTYTPIATTTLGSAQASVTFSSISGSYTDLVLIINGALSSSTADILLTFNSDSGSNYSTTKLAGSGSSAISSRVSNQNSIPLEWYAYLDTTYAYNSITNIFNYSNTTTYKTLIARANQAATGVNANVGLWRSTSAITTILLTASASTFVSGSTFTLYGIAAA